MDDDFQPEVDERSANGDDLDLPDRIILENAPLEAAPRLPFSSTSSKTFAVVVKAPAKRKMDDATPEVESKTRMAKKVLHRDVRVPTPGKQELEQDDDNTNTLVSEDDVCYLTHIAFRSLLCRLTLLFNPIVSTPEGRKAFSNLSLKATRAFLKGAVPVVLSLPKHQLPSDTPFEYVLNSREAEEVSKDLATLVGNPVLGKMVKTYIEPVLEGLSEEERNQLGRIKESGFEKLFALWSPLLVG